MTVRILAPLGVLLIAVGCATSPPSVPSQSSQAAPARTGSTLSAAEAEIVARLASPPAQTGSAAVTDGFPSGQSTAEGIACDLARAFINADSALFRRTCMPASFVKGSEYKEFLDELVSAMDQIKAGKAPNTGGPTSIKKLYKARSLSKNGPGSAGYAIYNLYAVNFVDVESPLTDGTIYTNRTLVFQFEDKTWRVMPRPDLVPLLSAGLNQESDSTEEWKPGSP